MNEFLLGLATYLPPSSDDPNADTVISQLVAKYPANQIVASSAALPNTQGLTAMGYWSGKLYVVGGASAFIYDPLNNMARTGTLTLSMSVPVNLNGSNYQDGKYLYVGWNRGNSDIYQIDLSTGAVVKFPSSGVTRGVPFVYAGYLYLHGGFLGTAEVKDRLYRINLASPTAWETVALNGTIDHSLTGGSAQVVGNRVYFVGGGLAASSTASSDGNTYTSVCYVDMATLIPGLLKLASSNITSGYHQATVVWDGCVFFLPYSEVTFRRWRLDTGQLSYFTSKTASGYYHNTFIRVGPILFISSYNENGIKLIPLSGA